MLNRQLSKTNGICKRFIQFVLKWSGKYALLFRLFQMKSVRKSIVNFEIPCAHYVGQMSILSPIFIHWWPITILSVFIYFRLLTDLD